MIGLEVRRMNRQIVVVADDEPHIRHVLALKLAKGGLQVFVAADGQEALELCRAEKPDLLITDNQMPALSGLDLCLQLREDPATADIAAIMLTARDFDLPTDQIKRAGILLVMSKPFSPAEVLNNALEILNRTVTVQERI